MVTLPSMNEAIHSQLGPCQCSQQSRVPRVLYPWLGLAAYEDELHENIDSHIPEKPGPG